MISILKLAFLAGILQLTVSDECLTSMNMTLLQKGVHLEASESKLSITERLRPNFLLLFPDAWRFDWDGFARPHIEEPALDLPTLKKLASRGIRFTTAYTPSPHCTPARSSIAAGREYDATNISGVFSDLEGDFDEVSDEMPSFMRLLRDAGYHTMTTGKDDLSKTSVFGMLTHASCPSCFWGQGQYHQAELGFSDSFRTGDKEQIFSYWPDPFESLGSLLHNSSSVLPNGSEMNNFDILHDCYNSA